MATEARQHTTLSTLGEIAKGGAKWSLPLALATLALTVGLPIAAGVGAGYALAGSGALVVGVGAVAAAAATFAVTAALSSFGAVATGAAGLVGAAFGLGKARSQSRAYEHAIGQELKQEQREILQDELMARANAAQILQEQTAAARARDDLERQRLAYFMQHHNPDAKHGHVEKHKPNGPTGAAIDPNKLKEQHEHDKKRATVEV